MTEAQLEANLKVLRDMPPERAVLVLKEMIEKAPSSTPGAYFVMPVWPCPSAAEVAKGAHAGVAEITVNGNNPKADLHWLLEIVSKTPKKTFYSNVPTPEEIKAMKDALFFNAVPPILGTSSNDFWTTSNEGAGKPLTEQTLLNTIKAMKSHHQTAMGTSMLAEPPRTNTKPTLQEALFVAADGGIFHKDIPGAITPTQIEFDNRVFRRTATSPPTFEEVA